MERPEIAPISTGWMRDLMRGLAFGRERFRSGRGMRLGELIEVLGPSGAALCTLLLAIPFLWPLSLGPITTPASIVLFLLGLQMARGNQRFPLPTKYLALPLPERMFRLMRRGALSMSWRWKWHRPVEGGDAARGSFRRFCGWGIVVSAVLLAVPIPMLPLTNTFPALGVVAFSVAWLRASQRHFGIGMAAVAASLVIFGALGAAVYFVGIEAVQRVLPG